MARKPNAFPSYLHHKASGQARVRINGRDYLLGPYGSDQSRIRYGELVSKLAGGIPIDPIDEALKGSQRVVTRFTESNVNLAKPFEKFIEAAGLTV